MIVYWLSVAVTFVVFLWIMIKDIKYDNIRGRRLAVGFLCMVYSVVGIVHGATVVPRAMDFRHKYVVAFCNAETIRDGCAPMDSCTKRALIDDIDEVNEHIIFNRKYNGHWFLGALCTDMVAELPIINYDE